MYERPNDITKRNETKNYVNVVSVWKADDEKWLDPSCKKNRENAFIGTPGSIPFLKTKRQKYGN